jgi:hypothetical protein
VSILLTLLLGSAAAWAVGELAMIAFWPLLVDLGLTLWWANGKLSVRFERWLLRRVERAGEE